MIAVMSDGFSVFPGDRITCQEARGRRACCGLIRILMFRVKYTDFQKTHLAGGSGMWDGHVVRVMGGQKDLVDPPHAP